MLPLLQERLVLNRYLLRELGFDDFKSLRVALKVTNEGTHEDGHTYFYYTIAGREGRRLAEDKLAGYDLRIRGCVSRLNSGFRSPPVRLKYFQWLAVLFTEMYLDRYFNEPEVLLGGLNRWLQTSGWSDPTPYSLDDLTKLAFWMATGSGKTLIMHINLWQYLYYCRRRHDNILLVTPNEGLSRQHVEELRKSGIPVQHYGQTDWNLFSSDRRELVTVIEITKLKLPREKTGEGLTLDVESLGENNLLLVDEGHRGAGGEKWRGVREHLARRGFTFEYSATFGQIVNGAQKARRRDLLDEYGKAIIFDYSYPHFYFDGYGKHYFIRNIDDDSETFNDWLVLGNLLSFYEQTLVFEQHREDYRQYNLEKPLWVFVGHSVTGGKTEEDKVSLTDVQEIVRFFADFLGDKARWAPRIGKVLAGKTGLDQKGRDVFADMYGFLKAQRLEPGDMYDDVLRRVFHAAAGEELRVVELKRVKGEIGMRVGAQEAYFGVINIGNVPGLIKLLGGQRIVCEEESIEESLFDRISKADSSVNVLIGSRKFMEGWDCFRVSSMGLMNIGRGEGSQIVQLFGRGVRLWGKGYSLKRSSQLEPATRPQHIDLLETLNVFGIRASYMNDPERGFLRYLRDEGIQQYEEIDVPIWPQREFLTRNLQVLRLPDGDEFAARDGVVLAVDDRTRVTLDMRPKLLDVRPGTEEEQVVAVKEKSEAPNQAVRLRELASILDWDRIYFSLLDLKHSQELFNLTFAPAVLRDYVERGNYELLCADDVLRAHSPLDIERVEDLVVQLLWKYAATCYDRHRRAWERERLRLRSLGADDRNLNFRGYLVRARPDFADRVRELVRQADRLKEQDEERLPFVHFDRHLYMPLLVERDGIKAMTPPGLVSVRRGAEEFGEKRLVVDIRRHLKANSGKFAGREVFLLRNLARGRGIGFFSATAGEEFYPDFILWLLTADGQRIAFIDPHGLRYTEAKWYESPKVQLYKELESFDGGAAGTKLTSYIVSTTPMQEALRHFGATQAEFEANHVLFQDDASYLAKLFSILAALA